MKRFSLFLLLFTTMFCLGSCDSKDGDWAPIEMTIDEKYVKKNTIEVPAEGGTYVMSSRNYGVPWLLGIELDGNRLLSEDYPMVGYSENVITHDWLNCTIDNQKGYTITIKPNLTCADRTIRFELECGDAFGAFTFVQKHGDYYL